MATTSHTPSSTKRFSPTHALLSLLLAAALVCSMGFGAVNAWADTSVISPPRAATDITLFHTNDMHGYLQGDGTKVVGIDKV
ncbi:MAG: hypothetical protein RSE94_23475, partial [Pseudomonas sp.]